VIDSNGLEWLSHPNEISQSLPLQVSDYRIETSLSKEMIVYYADNTNSLTH
jgi:hypothetical protein